jgi:DNA-binding MarR family transcriptional regulator
MSERNEIRAQATLDRVLALTVLLARDMAEYFERNGLTESRARVIWELQRRGPCKQQTLAAALGVAPRTITALVDGLADTGFVTREPHPADRRATLVTFTARGSDVAEALVHGKQTLARQLFSDLTGEQLDSFDSVLIHVLERLVKLIAEDSHEGAA